jgi:hypothetical protein
MKYSVVIPYYKNLQELKESIEILLPLKKVDDIVITHDCSDDYKEVLKLSHKKIRIYKNIQNWHILHNKRNAIYHAKNEWVICLDSDNKINKSYIDVLGEYELNTKIIFAPEFAKPQFNYTSLSDTMLSKETIKGYYNNSILLPFLNTFNYCVNRNEYLKVYKYSINCYSADSIYFNYLWLKSGRFIFVVPGLQYEHKVHKESTFLKEYNKSFKAAQNYYQKIKEL